MTKIRINVHTNKSKVLKKIKKFFPLRRIKNTHFAKGVCVTVVVLPPVITPCESKFVVVVVPV